MLRKKKDKKEKDIDISSLNHILKTGKKLISISYIMIIACLVFLGTYFLKEWKIFTYIKDILIVISPLFIGFIIAWLFDPLVRVFETKKIPRLLGCAIVYCIILGALFIVCYLFIPSLVSQIQDFVNAAPGIFNELSDFCINLIKKFDANGLINTNDIKDGVTAFITGYSNTFVSDIPKYLFSFGKTVVNGGVNFVFGLMIGFYILFDFQKINEFIKGLIPVQWMDNYNEITRRINTSLRSYVQGVLLVMLLVFITQSIGFTLAGMEAPILFALFCAVTDIIPYFGPYIGGIPAVIVGFTISPITGICVLISILIVQLLENNFYQPLIMGHTMKLHPVTIMISLLIFQHFFGIIGMVVATPVVACIKVLLQFVNEKYNIVSFGVNTDK